MLKSKNILSKAVPMALVASAVLPNISFADQQIVTKEISHSNIVDQSTAISKEAVGKSDTVILVKKDNKKNALKANIVAAKQSLPILIVDDVNSNTLKSLKEIGAKNVRVMGDIDTEELKNFNPQQINGNIKKDSKEAVVVSTDDFDMALALTTFAVRSNMDVFFSDEDLSALSKYDKVYVADADLADSIEGNVVNLAKGTRFNTLVNIAKTANTKNIVMLNNVGYNMNAALLGKFKDASVIVVNEDQEIKNAAQALKPEMIYVLGDADSPMASAEQAEPAHEIARRAVEPEAAQPVVERIEVQPKVEKQPQVDNEEIKNAIVDALDEGEVKASETPKAEVETVEAPTVKATENEAKTEETTPPTSTDLESLRQELQDEIAKRDKLAEEVSSIEAQIAELTKEQEQSEEVTEQPETTTETRTVEQPVDNSGKISELNARIDRLKAEASGIESQLANLPQSETKENPEYQAILNELEALRAQGGSQKESNEDGSEKENTENQGSDNSARIAELENQLNNTSQYITEETDSSQRQDLQTRLSDAQGQIADLESQITSLQNETDVKEEVVEVKTETSKKTAFKVNNSDKIAELQSLLVEKKALLEESNAKIAMIQESIDKEEARLAEEKRLREEQEQKAREEQARKEAEAKAAQARKEDQQRADNATVLVNQYGSSQDSASYNKALNAINTIQDENSRNVLLTKLNENKVAIEKAQQTKKDQEQAQKNLDAANAAVANYKNNSSDKNYNNALKAIDAVQDRSAKNQLMTKLNLQKQTLDKIKAEASKKKEPISNQDALKRLEKDLAEFKRKGYNGLSKSNIFYLTNISGLSPAQLEKGLRFNLKGHGDAFIKAEQEYGVNAILLAAIASHESNYGRSNIALKKGNLFGWNAFDATPYDSATQFDSYDKSILGVASKIKRLYLSDDGRYFKGYTTEGMNVYYCTGNTWSGYINRMMIQISESILR